MRRKVLRAGFTLAGTAFVLAAWAAPRQTPPDSAQQSLPAIQPGEEDGFQWILRQRAFPLGYIPAGVDVRALRQIEDMEWLRRTTPAEDVAGVDLAVVVIDAVLGLGCFAT